MAKRGTPFERVVAEVLAAMNPGAAVQQGTWVQGPDGRRDRDVIVDGSVDGETWSILIECKDYNPDTTGPVGIEIVDALESKRRDLSIRTAMICSNAGFTRGAVRKAARVGIGLVSVMRMGDQRIRFTVSDMIYSRQIKLDEVTNIKLQNVEPIGSDPIDLTAPVDADLTFQGLLVKDWIFAQIASCIVMNPVVNGSFTANYHLLKREEFGIGARRITATDLEFTWRISGGWFEQLVTIDATHGLFDWLRHSVRLGPGPRQLVLKDVAPGGGIPIPQPPERELRALDDREYEGGQVHIAIALVEGVGDGSERIPDLSSHIEPTDLNNRIPDLQPENYTSTPPTVRGDGGPANAN